MKAARSHLFGPGFNASPPADPEVIADLRKQAEPRLPDDYLDFLSEANGGEGAVGETGYLILFPAEQIASLNEAYEVNRWAEGLVIFGSDGGGEAFAFDSRTVPPSIVSVPFVGMSLALARGIAADLRGFATEILGA